jgi:hypothetical protein
MRISSAMSRNTIPTDHTADCSCITDITVPGTQIYLYFFSARHLATTTSLGVAIILLNFTVYSLHDCSYVRRDVKKAEFLYFNIAGISDCRHVPADLPTRQMKLLGLRASLYALQDGLCSHLDSNRAFPVVLCVELLLFLLLSMFNRSWFDTREQQYSTYWVDTR